MEISDTYLIVDKPALNLPDVFKLCKANSIEYRMFEVKEPAPIESYVEYYDHYILEVKTPEDANLLKLLSDGMVRKFSLMEFLTRFVTINKKFDTWTK
jgi:hypothetical protein